MDSNRDEVALAGVEARLATMATEISTQSGLLHRVLGSGASGYRERIDLWDLERRHARLGSEQMSTRQRIALGNAQLVVLVVEDDAIQMMLTVERLTAAGFTVIEATSADEAIACLEADSAIGAMLTDVQMPGSMDGRALARLVNQRWPAIRIVVASADPSLGQDDVADRDYFVSKPYWTPDVVAALRIN